MKRFLYAILYVCLCFSPISSYSMTVDNLIDNPKYIKVERDNNSATFIDKDSVTVIEYNPPYYVIKAVTYKVDYPNATRLKTVVSEFHSIYRYNIQFSMATVLAKSNWSYSDKIQYKLSHTGIDSAIETQIMYIDGNNRGPIWPGNAKKFYSISLSNDDYKEGNLIFKLAYGDVFDNTVYIMRGVK